MPVFNSTAFDNAAFNTAAEDIIAPVGIASAEAFGTPSLVYVVAPEGIASAEAFGVLEVRRLLEIITPDGIASAEAFGVAALRSTATIAAEGIASAEAFGVPLVRRGAVGFALPAFTRWRPVVTLDGVDVSAQLVGEIRVEAEEGAARLADFRLAVPPGTAINLADYSGAAVTVDFAESDAGGAPIAPQRLFTGIVDLPEYDFASRTIGFRCTDDLQGRVAALTRAQVEALLGAGSRYSTAVFQPTADVWQYALDRASTVAASLDLTPSGVPRVTPWVAAAAADLVLTDADILDGSGVDIALANREQIRNRVSIAFSYRFPRLKKRTVAVNYTIVGGFAGAWWQFLRDGHVALTRDAVRNAISSLGWAVEGGADAILFDSLPPSGIYYTPQNAPLNWFNDPAVTAGLCVGYSARLIKQYSQTIEERYAITVENAASVAALGALVETRETSLEAEFDSASWEEAANRQPFGGKFAGYVTNPVVPTLPSPGSVGEVRVDHAPNTETDRAAADRAIETLVAAAQTRIFAAHRQNAVRVSCVLSPDIDVDKTVAVNAASIQARGKLRAVTHTMDLDSGAATSSLELAVVALSGVGYEHAAGPIEPPPAPADPGPDAGASFKVLVAYGYLPTADHVLEIEAPGIDDASRDNSVIDVPSDRAATLVEDLFTVTA